MAKKQFPLMLESEQRERLERAAEKHPMADNLTSFLRIAGENERMSLEEEDEPVEVDLSEIERGQEKILEQLEVITEKLEDIDTKAGYDPELDECAAKIIQYVPKDPEVEVQSRDPMGADFGSIEERVMTAGRIIDIVSLLAEEGYDEYTIRRAAEKAETEFEDLHHTSVDGEIRYYFWNERDNSDTSESGEE